ncbi:MAG: GIY-YIG nuclease family protein, partial [Bacteroidia bacterium]
MQRFYTFAIMLSSKLKQVIISLPETPGVYKYFDEEKKLIYIGKAKNLKKRVNSYFTKTHDSRKTEVMVNKISHIEYTLVETEMDALLLENSLIKKYQPKYNVMLKDDKTYPFICIKKERFPRVFSTRNFVRDGSEYFGPFSSGLTRLTVLELIHSLFQLRNCNLNLSETNIKNKKFKVCLEYHIGNCKAPCVGFQTEADYMDQIKKVRNILKGNIRSVITDLKELMHEASSEMQFEKAGAIKKKIDLLENYQSKSTVVN